MAGRKQHHIPQLLLRGFANRRGKAHQLVVFDRDGRVYAASTADVGAERDFYSGVSGELDDEITQYESRRLAPLVQRARDAENGDTIDAAEAAEIVAHLVPRTKQVRLLFAEGMQSLLQTLDEIFGDELAVSRMLGIDGLEITDVFREQFDRALRDQIHLIESIGVPRPLLERIAFILVKENFSTLWAAQHAEMGSAIEQMSGQVDGLTRDAHVRALTTGMVAPKRIEALSQLRWKVIEPPEPNILPDSVAIARSNGSWLPMLLGGNIPEIVVLPLSSDRTLVGISEGAAEPDLSEYVAQAAACSQRFFVARDESSQLRSLISTIGSRSADELQNMMVSIASDYEKPSGGEDLSQEPDPAALSPAPVREGVRITLQGYDDPEKARQVGELISQAAISMSEYIPLDRLDGISVAYDYEGTLATLDRGFVGIKPLTTVDPEVGVGVAKSAYVKRDAGVFCHLVLRAGIADLLLSDNPDESGMALHVLVTEFARVAWLSYFERALPGYMLSQIDDPLRHILMRGVEAAACAYAAARMSSGFGRSRSTATAYEEITASAYQRMKDVVPARRLEYRDHGNLDQLLDETLPHVSLFLESMARLLGHLDGCGEGAAAIDPSILTSLQVAGLENWVSSYVADLRSIWNRRAGWSSSDEIEKLNVHTERILWTFGILPWVNTEGECRVEVPLIIDIEALSRRAG